MEKQMKLIDIEDIFVPDDNVRSENPETDEDLESLKASIHATRQMAGGEPLKALLQPISVRNATPDDDTDKKYVLRYGFRRFHAFLSIFQDSPTKNIWARRIPGIVDVFIDDEQTGAELHYRIIENLQRKDMNILDEARAIEKLMKVTKSNQSQVAKLLGQTKGWVSQRLKLLKMAPEVQTKIEEGELGQGKAREIARISDHDKQREVLEELEGEDKPTVKDVKKKVRKAKREERKEDTEDTDTEDTEELTHEEKVEAVKKRAESNDTPPGPPEPDPVIERVTTEMAALQKRVKSAKSKDEREKAIFYSGAEQALRYANGEIKTVRFDSRMFED